MAGVVLLPLRSIAERDLSPLVPSAFGLRQATLRLDDLLRPLHVSNSYAVQLSSAQLSSVKRRRSGWTTGFARRTSSPRTDSCVARRAPGLDERLMRA